jgi:hypothetical protein
MLVIPCYLCVALLSHVIMVPIWELVSTRMAAAHGLVRAPARSRVRAPSSATFRLELLLLNSIPQGSSPAGLVFYYGPYFML